jgi:hypothetical protein
MSNDQARVEKFIVDLHKFISGWVSGQVTDESQWGVFIKNFSPDFMVVMPAGRGFGVETFTGYMTSIHGKNPKFKIQIRNVTLRPKVNGVCVVMYEEWEKDAMDSDPANNGRQSSMVLRERGDSFEVLHLQETWLPAEKMAADPSDF